MGLGIGNLLPPGLFKPPPKSEPKPVEPVQTAPVAPQPPTTEPASSAPPPVVAAPPAATAPAETTPAETAQLRPVNGPLAIAQQDETGTSTQSLIEAYRRERTVEASPATWISRSEATFAAPATVEVAVGTKAEIIARAAYSLVVDAGAVDTRRTLIETG